MKVLVTGGGGFIGTHLVEAQLRKGRDVVAFDVNTSSLSHLTNKSKLQIVEGDIRDGSLLNQIINDVDWVFHLASVHLSIRTPDTEYKAINVDGTRQLLEVSHRKSVSRFVHCSSVGVYGKIQRPPADEESVCAPESIYDVTKLEGEREVNSFHEETGFPVVVVRPAWVYGPGCPRTLKLFNSISRGRFFFVGNGDSLRHCLYVQDLLEGFELCATVEQAVGNTYILADKRPVTTEQLVATMSNILGTRMPTLRVPLWAIYPLCLASETVFKCLRKEPPFSRRSLNFFTNNTNFDISKAREELNFDPNTSLNEGLKFAYNYMLNQGAFS